MAVFQYYFTVEEANRLVPQLQGIFARIREIIRRLRERRELITELSRMASGNGGALEVSENIKDVVEIHRMVRGIEASGIIVKDLARGLVDFPHLREGQEVFLCWKLGEDEVRYWHTLHGGYAGRQPL